MRIGVDVMGGDHAPDAILKGAFAALEDLDPADVLVLAGDAGLIEEGIRERGIDPARVDVVGTSDEIAMDESPVEAVRAKKTSSIVTLARMASLRKAATLGVDPLDGFVSAGNTGACVSAAQMHMRRLPSVHRPGIAVTMPTFGGPVVLIDVGANIEPKPHHLAQYGAMGSIYARRALGIERPRVSLMNVGGEEQKGTDELKYARDMLRADDELEFVGYMEGRAVFDGEADVVVTDGVVGNVMIKLAEGLSAGIFRAIAQEIIAADPDLLQRFEPIVKSIYARHDYHEYGGAPLLGVNGICLISHGSSEARTIRAAVGRIRQLVECGVNQAISEHLAELEVA